MSASNPLGNILLVDDDKNIAELLRTNLSSEGFGVIVVPVAKDVKLDQLGDFRLAIIDAMQQQYNGIELSSDIKANPETSKLPIIVCTTAEGEDIIISAFDNGAEDFVSKPFSLRELIARVKAILRRHPQVTNEPAPRKELSFPTMGMTIDPDHQKVTVEEMVVPLTKTEYSILIFLILNRNSFFTRMDICNEVWKEDAQSNVRIVDTNISRLRKKLGDCGKYIINRYGMGYAFVDKVAQ